MAGSRARFWRSRWVLVGVLCVCAVVSVAVAAVVGDNPQAPLSPGAAGRGIMADDDNEPAHQHDASAGMGTAGQGQPLGRSCDRSGHPEHDGYEVGAVPRCVTTQMGEMPAAPQAPQLLIAAAPSTVRAGEPFTLTVSVRNLVRDRFPAAATGGFYLESSFLDEAGLVRGHLHVACRHLPDGRDAAPSPAEADSFQAVEDGGGAAAPDEVEVTVPGLEESGVAQCVAWAGDGSHRVPMMPRVHQIPAVDAVMLTVTS